MRDIPYLLLDDPDVRQRLSPWLNEQIQNLDKNQHYRMSCIQWLENLDIVNDQLDSSPFAELEVLQKKKAPLLRTVWKYQPPGELQISRLLENKAAFVQTSEYHELQQNRPVIFNVGESFLLDQEKLARYQTILLQKLGENKENNMNSKTKKQLVKQSLLDATYHLNRLIGQRSGVLSRYIKNKKYGITYGLRLYTPDIASETDKAKWLWTQMFYEEKDPDLFSHEETDVLRISVPLPVNQLPKEWQDSVIVDDDMLDRLLTRYLESLSREQVDNLRKASQSPVQ